MKKLLLSLAVLGLMATPALAEDGEKGSGHGKGGKHHLEMDTDGDGAISKAEFMAVQEKRFSELDANSNGSIEKEEFQAFRDKMKGKRGEYRDKMKDKRGERPAPTPEAGEAE